MGTASCNEEASVTCVFCRAGDGSSPCTHCVPGSDIGTGSDGSGHDAPAAQGSPRVRLLGC